MLNYPPRGLIADLITPLEPGGRVDHVSLGRLLEGLRTETQGFRLGGPECGESLDLDPGQRLDMLSTVVRACSESTAVFFEITTGSGDDTRDLLTRTEALLADLKPKGRIFYLVTPLIYRGNRDLPAHLEQLGRLTRRSLIPVNDPALVEQRRPGPHHKNIRTGVLKKLVRNEQIVGLAYDGDLERAINYQRAVRQRTGFRMYDLSEDNFLRRPSSSGLISRGANLLPQCWSDIVKSSLNLYDTQRLFPDHLSRIWQSGRRVRLLLDAYRQHPALTLKTALTQMGLIASDALLSPGPPPDASWAVNLSSLLRELHLI